MLTLNIQTISEMKEECRLNIIRFLDKYDRQMVTYQGKIENDTFSIKDGDIYIEGGFCCYSNSDIIKEAMLQVEKDCELDLVGFLTFGAYGGSIEMCQLSVYVDGELKTFATDDIYKETFTDVLHCRSYEYRLGIKEDETEVYNLVNYWKICNYSNTKDAEDLLKSYEIKDAPCRILFLFVTISFAGYAIGTLEDLNKTEKINWYIFYFKNREDIKKLNTNELIKVTGHVESKKFLDKHYFYSVEVENFSV